MDVKQLAWDLETERGDYCPAVGGNSRKSKTWSQGGATRFSKGDTGWHNWEHQSITASNKGGHSLNSDKNYNSVLGNFRISQNWTNTIASASTGSKPEGEERNFGKKSKFAPFNVWRIDGQEKQLSMF